jgi:hypothetical protein
MTSPSERVTQEENPMTNGRYSITESVGSRRETVHSFEDLEKHHPSRYAETGRNYEVINGEREEVSYAGERTFVKKDFILQVDGSAAVDIPSPVSGYVYYERAYGAAKIYDAPRPDGALIAKVLHMDPETFRVPNGAEVAYGQGLGRQGGTGPVGTASYGIHAHVETDVTHFQRYISDIDSGVIRMGQIPEPSIQATTPPTPATPQTQATLQQTGTLDGGALGVLIGRGEGGYGSYNMGRAGDANGRSIDFSQMTVNEVQRRQDLPQGDPNRLFAVGKYQVIPGTMDEAVRGMGITGEERMTPELQERMFSEYLIAEKRPQIKDYITGVTNGEEGLRNAQLATAREWASVADPATGLSVYGGVGNNRASITAAQSAAALNEMRTEYQENLRSGMSPDDAYRRLSGPGGDPILYPPTAAPSTPDRAPATASPTGRQKNGVFDRGDQGEDVRNLQGMLKTLGCKIETDGKYGPETERVVRGYQMMNGLEPDGIVGPNTMRAIKADLAERTATLTSQATATEQPARAVVDLEVRQPAPPAAALTANQTQQLELISNRITPALIAKGYSSEQVAQISAATLSHIETHAGKGEAQHLMVSNDGQRIAVLHAYNQISEMPMTQAFSRTTEEHFAQAALNADAQSLTRSGQANQMALETPSHHQPARV